jgi:hypothetical protein
MNVRQILAWERMGRPVICDGKTVYLGTPAGPDHVLCSDMPRGGATNKTVITVTVMMIPVDKLTIDESLITT